MTNFEKYKDEILQLTNKNKRFGFGNNGIVDCNDIVDCTTCKFINGWKNCRLSTIKWLYEEYIEPIKLTHKQLAILKILETGWLARDDSSNVLYWYSEKPKRVSWHFEKASESGKSMSVRDIFDAFDFITFKDEPFSVEEMLKWEVVND